MYKTADIIAIAVKEFTRENNKKLDEEMISVVRSFIPIMLEVVKTSKAHTTVLGNGLAQVCQTIRESTEELIDRPQIYHELSDPARYLIWWLTQIETDVCDQTASWETYKTKTDLRADSSRQSPTKKCLDYLDGYSDLKKDFEDLLKVPSDLKNKNLKVYLDEVVQKIWSLKQKIAKQVTSIDDDKKDQTKSSTTQTGA